MHPAWNHVRAALIAVHLAVITVAALPTPAGYLAVKNQQIPEVRASLEAWGAIAIRLGLAPDQPTFVDRVWGAGGALVTARSTLIEPFAPYFWLTGTRQSWRMFGTVDRRVGRFEVHLHERGKWRPLYVDLTEYDWQARIFDQERVRALRKLHSNRGSKRYYQNFVRWFAARAEAEFPDADQFRMRFQGLDIGPPAQLLEEGTIPETKRYWVETVPIGAAR